MAITLDGKTKLTHDVERGLVRLGGGDPNKTLTERELGEVLSKAIDRMAENGCQSLLNRFYDSIQKRRPELGLPTRDELEQRYADQDPANDP
jgi:hypothetical protein